MCRPCRSAYHREHYLANKQRYVDQALARKEALRLKRTSYLLNYFASPPCVDCGEDDPVVLEFDHVNADDKSFDIGHSLPYRNWQSILEEIEKCEVVCANCHRRRTAHQNGSLRAVLTAMRDEAGDRT
jgi:5-methylcytosine-specific restriction endonuclease McrA